MARGPTKDQITRHIRERLQALRDILAGKGVKTTYMKGSTATYAGLEGNDWVLFPRVLRASNGECAIMWHLSVGWGEIHVMTFDGAYEAIMKRVKDENAKTS